MNAVVQALDVLPGCVGDEQIPEQRCRMRPVEFVIGTDFVNGEHVLIYTAACPLHVQAVKDYLGRPFGTWGCPYDAGTFRAIVQVLMEEEERLSEAWLLMAGPEAMAG